MPQALPTFQMQTFVMPKEILGKLNSMMGDFSFFFFSSMRLKKKFLYLQA